MIICFPSDSQWTQAPIIAVIEISTKVLSLIKKYYSGVKNAKSDIEQLSHKVLAYRDILQNVHDLVKREGSMRLPTASVQSIEKSRDDIAKMQSKLDPGHRHKAMKRVGLTALKWPFSNKEVNELITILEKYMASLNIALNVDQT